MGLWTWKAFITEGGRNIVQEWADSVDWAVWNAFCAHVKYLDPRGPQYWVRPWVGTLRGGKKEKKNGCNGLHELRFDVGNVEYRPIGYYSGKMEFTILYFAEEHDGE